MKANLQQTYFELFQLPKTFQINEKDLTQAYKALQRSYHPDRFATAPQENKRLSLAYSTFINQGYETLKSPIRRASYLLELAGVGFAENENIQDESFLKNQIALREQVEALSTEDNRKNHLKLLALRDKMQQNLETLEKDFVEAYNQNSPENLNKAQVLVRKMQFFRKLDQQLIKLQTRQISE